MTIKKKRLVMDIAHLERQATHDYERAETEDSEEMRRLVNKHEPKECSIS